MKTPRPCPGLRPPLTICLNQIYPRQIDGTWIYRLRCDSCEELVKSFIEEEMVG